MEYKVFFCYLRMLSILTGMPSAIDVVLVALLLTLKIFHTLSSISIINFGEVNARWEP